MLLRAAAAAAAADEGIDFLPLVERFGLPLFFLGLMVSGLVVTKKQLEQVIDLMSKQYDDMRKDRDAQRDALAALQASLTRDIVPAIALSTEAVTRANTINEARRLAGGG